jgi:phage terminase small subunit
MSEERRLTDKQRLFAEHYVGEARFNATKAATLAGYSPKTAYEIGSQNLRKLEIRARIDEVLEARGVNQFQTLSELSDVAYSEWRDHVQIIYDNEGNEKDAILQLRDKVKALEVLAKIQGLTIERQEIRATVEGKVYAGFDPDKV